MPADLIGREFQVRRRSINRLLIDAFAGVVHPVILDNVTRLIAGSPRSLYSFYPSRYHEVHPLNMVLTRTILITNEIQPLNDPTGDTDSSENVITAYSWSPVT